jgi:gluconolactonase
VSSLLRPGAVLEVLWTGSAFGEGPVWMPEPGRLRWSDIPNNRILEYDPDSGCVVVHRHDVEFTNGRTLDRDGRVVQCSHGRRSIELEVDGEVLTLVDRWGEFRLNSPNDVVVASDGSIWFSDPPYGILLPEEGHPGTPEYGGFYVFRLDPRSGDLDPVVTDLERPNGLAFSPDESTLYVSDTTNEWRGLIRSYPVDIQIGAVGEGADLAVVTPGCSDGFRVDADGRIWTSAGDGIHILTPDGVELQRISTPEAVSNLCFGGPDGRDLYITGATSLYRIKTQVDGSGRASGARPKLV